MCSSDLARVWSIGFTATLIAIAACGARSGLDAGKSLGEADAGLDVTSEEPPRDVVRPMDAKPPMDAEPDVHVEDCAEAGEWAAHLPQTHY